MNNHDNSSERDRRRDRAAPMLLRGHRSAAETLGLSERKVQELCACNALPHARADRAYLFDPDELRAWFRAGCPSYPGAAIDVRAHMERGGAA
ncbi:MAG: helix-turn-helix domain-containing protein [Planctomycetota bacterium]